MAFRNSQVNQENMAARGAENLPVQPGVGAVKARLPLEAVDNQERFTVGTMKQKKGLAAKPDIRRPSRHLKRQRPVAPCVAPETKTKEEESVEEIDDIGGSPQLCGEYAKEIYSYLHELEKKYHVKPEYMSRQREINEKMRRVLVDWLVRVHRSFSLLQETLYLTVSVLDRYLAVCSVKKPHLQLVGVTAMLIASKYEEMYAPEISDFVYITDNAYTSGEMRALERVMLKKLSYSLGSPLPPHFLRRNSRAGNATNEIHTMAKMFLELCLPEYSMLCFKPSLQAAAAFYLATRIHSAGDWTPTLQHYSTYSVGDMMPCLRLMAKLVRDMHIGKHQAVREKYESNSLLHVAKDPRLSSSVVMSLAADKV